MSRGSRAFVLISKPRRETTMDSKAASGEPVLLGNCAGLQSELTCGHEAARQKIVAHAHVCQHASSQLTRARDKAVRPAPMLLRLNEKKEEACTSSLFIS